MAAAPNRQLHPSQLDPKTGEPFLQLRKHENVILTPMRREEDKPAIVKCMNDKAIATWLSSPPFPYTEADADWWFDRIIPPAEKALRLLEDRKDDAELVIVDECIVGTIREVQEDGSSVLIGHIVIHRCPWMERSQQGIGKSDEVIREMREKNDSLPAGDPSILWTVGYWLFPTHHRRGIVSDALNTLLHEWAIPRMGVRKILGTAFEGNAGSVRVLQNAGMVYRETVKNIGEIKGVMRSLQLFDAVYSKS